MPISPASAIASIVTVSVAPVSASPAGGCASSIRGRAQAQRRAPLRHRRRPLRALPRPRPAIFLRLFRTRGHDAGGGAAAKKRHIAAKLAIEPGQKRARHRLGLGRARRSISPRPATSRCTGVTLSSEQHRGRRASARARGLSNGTSHFELRDYRELDGQLRPHRLGRHVRACRRRPLPRLLRARCATLLEPRRRRAAPFDRPLAGPPSPPMPSSPSTSSPAATFRPCRRWCRRSSSTGLMVTDIEILRLHYAETLRALARALPGQPRHGAGDL